MVEQNIENKIRNKIEKVKKERNSFLEKCINFSEIEFLKYYCYNITDNIRTNTISDDFRKFINENENKIEIKDLKDQIKSLEDQKSKKNKKQLKDLYNKKYFLEHKDHISYDYTIVYNKEAKWKIKEKKDCCDLDHINWQRCKRDFLLIKKYKSLYLRKDLYNLTSCKKILETEEFPCEITCSHCGTLMDIVAKYCSECGEKL